jgi:hypothetical protein
MNMRSLIGAISVSLFLAISAHAAVQESSPTGIAGVEVFKDGTKIYLTIYPSSVSAADGYGSFVYDETSTLDVSDFFKLMQAQALTAKTLGGQNVSIRHDGPVLKGLKILN